MTIKNYCLFVYSYIKFKKQTKDNRFKISWLDKKIILNENTPHTDFDRHYIYHPAWAARILAKTKPKEHIDISSTLSFCSIISAFIPTKFYDYRPAGLNLDNLVEDKADLVRLPFADNSISSLSCMHTVEHIGLGRYGDNIDPNADLKTLSELERVLAFGGNMLLVVPIGKPRIQFNAHRIYSYEQIIASLPKLKLQEFCLIPDDKQDGGIIKNPEQEIIKTQKYGCGCFWLTKI